MSDDEVSLDYEAHAQWSADCDFCDHTAKHYCKSCGIKLCSLCKDDHLSKKLYRKHEAVPYTSGVRTRKEATSECSNHPGKRYQLYCKSCRVPVCSPCIVEIHVMHELTSISDAYETIEPKAISQLQTMSQNIRPRLRRDLEGLNQSEVNIISAIADTEQRMKESAHHIHKEVDDILAENLKELQKIKDETIMPLLQEKVRNTKAKLSQLDEKILSFDKHLRSDDPVELIKFMTQGDEESVDMCSNHFVDSQLLPTFAGGCISKEILQQQFGKLLTTERTSSLSTDNDISESNDIKSGYFCIDRDTEGLSDKRGNNDTELKLIPTPVFEGSFTMKYIVWGLRLRSPNEAWVHDHGSTKFDLLDRSGNVVRIVDAGCRLYDVSGMCVADDGGLVYSDNHTQCIRSLSPSGNVSTLFTTEDRTLLGLCRLMSGELVVGMEGGGIRIYNADGRVLREINCTHVKYPNYITINKLSDDICVSDNFKKVVALKKNGVHRFTYTGHGSGSRFNPYDLCSDRQGRLLITDGDNHRIHIVDQDGQFIQYLATQKDGIQRAVSIDVNGHKHAWAGEDGSPKVKIIKYLE